MSRKGRGKKKSGISGEQLKDQILSILSRNPKQGFNSKQIAKRLNINDPAERQMISEIMRNLKKQEIVEEIYQGKYRTKIVHAYVTGTVDMTRMGYGFVTGEDIKEDIFVSARNLKTALHGDKVKVWLYARRKGARPEGEVVEIIERWRNSFVGTIEVLPGLHSLFPDNKNLPLDLFIPLSKAEWCKAGTESCCKGRRVGSEFQESVPRS
jgi:ribonuclease R